MHKLRLMDGSRKTLKPSVSLICSPQPPCDKHNTLMQVMIRKETARDKAINLLLPTQTLSQLGMCQIIIKICIARYHLTKIYGFTV